MKAGFLNSAAHWRGHEGRVNGKDLIEIWARQKSVDLGLVPCAICGVETGEWIFDHIVPLSKGGLHAPQNIQIICRECNRTKTANDVRKPVHHDSAIQSDLFEGHNKTEASKS